MLQVLALLRSVGELEKIIAFYVELIRANR